MILIEVDAPRRRKHVPDSSKLGGSGRNSNPCERFRCELDDPIMTFVVVVLFVGCVISALLYLLIVLRVAMVLLRTGQKPGEE
ncbi:MAG: hypothetical protein RKU31_44480 [Deltaproteobacteria bacterium]